MILKMTITKNDDNDDDYDDDDDDDDGDDDQDNREEDDGMYTCTVSNAHGSISHTIKVSWIKFSSILNNHCQLLH